MALVRAAASEQDAAIYLTAAFTGLRRGELLALRWRDVDFAGSAIRVRASYAGGVADDAEVRQGPLGSDGARRGDRARSTRRARALDRRRRSRVRRRSWWLPRRDLRFAGGTAPRCDRAGLRPLRFHDLRHTFGTRMIAKADIRRVQEWMGHADIQTTMRYLHYAPKEGDAALVAEAFALKPAPTVERPA